MMGRLPLEVRSGSPRIAPQVADDYHVPLDGEDAGDDGQLDSLGVMEVDGQEVDTMGHSELKCLDEGCRAENVEGCTAESIRRPVAEVVEYAE